MRNIRFFCRQIKDNDAISISDAQFRHLSKVLRFRQGDNVEIFDGNGIVADCIIEKIAKDAAILKIQKKNLFEPRKNQRIIIAASFAKGQRFEQVVEMCSQLGIDRIIPVIFNRTVKQPVSEMSAKRLESIAIESAKQCGRNFLPVIDKPLNFEKALDNLKNDFPQAQIVFGSLSKDADSIINLKFDSRDVAAFIGPEGGLTETEEDLLKKFNARPLRLTETILRIETAAIAFASILAAKRGSE